MINRRAFLKLLGAVGAAVGLPVKALAKSEVVTCHDATMTLNGKRIEPVKWPRTQVSQELIDDGAIDLQAWVRGELYGTNPHPPAGFIDEIDCDELYDDGTLDGCSDYVNAYDEPHMPGDGPGPFARWHQSSTGYWHHYALTWQDGTEKVWIDGKQVGPIPDEQYDQRTGNVFGVPVIWHEDV